MLVRENVCDLRCASAWRFDKIVWLHKDKSRDDKYSDIQDVAKYLAEVLE